MGERILQGSLKAISAPDLLTFINMIKKTGVLQVEDGVASKQVFWQSGEIIFASSSDPDESLGAFLIRHGKITQEDNERSGAEVTPGRRQGKVLVQMGILTPKELWWAVKNQVLDILYSLFGWSYGTFYFEETGRPYEEKIKLSTSTTNIIMEGIRRLDEWPRIREFIPSDNLVPILAPEESRDASVKFYEKELEVLQLVNNKRTIRSVIHSSDMSEFEVMRLIMSFVIARYIVIPAGGKSVSEEIEDAKELQHLIRGYNKTFSEIAAALREHLDDAEAEDLLRTIIEESRDPILEGLGFDAKGRLDTKILTSNVADLGSNMRHSSLDASLNNLLSFLLFEASKHLDADQKTAIYKMVERKAVKRRKKPSPART